MLKSLQRAQTDGDHIYGVIKGGRVNQDGRSNGISAPSANSQTQLITETYNTYGINPEEITYVEAHGTGTKLGDPIEFTALTRAFRQFTAKTGFCAIGSLKSNIGHTLAAAGVGGFIKVLLSMKYGQLAPSLHFQDGNEHIDFESSPFFVNTALRDWPRGERPRQAVVSSFGLSGTNCHLVIADAPEPVPCPRGRLPTKCLIVLSARTETALARCIENLRGWVEREGGQHALLDVAYTLASGRCHFKFRLAFTVKDIAGLQQTLVELETGKTPDNVWRGTSEGMQKPDLAQEKDAQTDAQTTVTALTNPDDENAMTSDTGLNRLGQLYVGTANIDWNKLYSSYSVQRISLPTYSFEREHYWLAKPAVSGQVLASAVSQRHPLLHENVSTLREQRFTSRFHGSECFLSDHRVNGHKVLPGVCYLVMARVAGELAGECAVGALLDVTWLKPLVVEQQPVDVAISLFSDSLFSDNHRIGFEVAHEENGERVVNARGWIAQMSGAESPGGHLDIKAIGARCGESYNRETLYRRFSDAGLAYGASFRLIEQLSCGDGEALARLGPPDQEPVTQAPLLSELPLLDATLQTVAGIAGQLSGDSGHRYLPFSLGQLEWLGPLPQRGYAYARLVSRRDDTWFFDVTLTDEAGQIALCCRDFAVRRAAEKAVPESGEVTVLNLLRQLESGELEIDEAETLIVRHGGDAAGKKQDVICEV
ncbi:MAG: polyketide synthase dehydratase domain-containing protein [Ectothiorhodospiraceae bacterium]|nr:polyketide synthase dehydratase domain-containing protein [Ectothiorhodospiraceae bacterium]